MRKRIFAPIIIIATLLISCDDMQTPRVRYTDGVTDTLTVEKMLEDTTKILIASMPIHFDSTAVLIHPIGWEDVYLVDSYGVNVDRLKKADRVSSSSQYISYNNRNYISGSMVNLLFEDIETGELRKLTDKAVVITSVKYLTDVIKKTGKHYLIYTVYDRDYNRDGKLDYRDLSACYMSNLDGTNFTKITQDYHYLEFSQLVEQNGKYYYRTIEDVNKDGIYNKKDKYHYYYIDLNKEDFASVEYFPLDLLEVK